MKYPIIKYDTVFCKFTKLHNFRHDRNQQLFSRSGRLPADRLHRRGVPPHRVRSSDGMGFRMLKLDLGRSSPVFQDMLSFPQPPSDAASGDELPVVALSESRDVLELLLPFCFLDATPALHTLEDACKVIEPARKYDIKRAIDVALATAIHIAEKDPFRVYAYACLYKIDTVAKTAARLCMRLTLEQLECHNCSGDVLALLSALDHHLLLTYRDDCAQAVSHALNQWASYLPGGPAEAREWCECTRREPGTYREPGIPAGYHISPWWDHFLINRNCDLQRCSWEGLLQENDALEAFFHWHSRNGGAPCVHDNAVVMRRIERFFPILRSQVSAAIDKVSLITSPAALLDHRTVSAV